MRTSGDEAPERRTRVRPKLTMSVPPKPPVVDAPQEVVPKDEGAQAATAVAEPDEPISAEVFEDDDEPVAPAQDGTPPAGDVDSDDVPDDEPTSAAPVTSVVAADEPPVAQPGWPAPGELMGPLDIESLDPMPVPVAEAETTGPVPAVTYADWPATAEATASETWTPVNADEAGTDDAPGGGASAPDPHTEWNDDDFDPATGWSEGETGPRPAPLAIDAERATDVSANRTDDATHGWDDADSPLPDADAALHGPGRPEGRWVTAASVPDLGDWNNVPEADDAPHAVVFDSGAADDVTWNGSTDWDATGATRETQGADAEVPPIIMHLLSGREELKVVIERDELGSPVAWVLSGSAVVAADGSAIRVKMPTPGEGPSAEAVAAAPVPPAAPTGPATPVHAATDGLVAQLLFDRIVQLEDALAALTRKVARIPKRAATTAAATKKATASKTTAKRAATSKATATTTPRTSATTKTSAAKPATRKATSTKAATTTSATRAKAAAKTTTTSRTRRASKAAE